MSSAATPAYVLCGGKSSRFGSDKARAVIDGTPLIVRAADVLQAVGADVIAVADTCDKYADLGLPTIADRRTEQGPLAGLETALIDRRERHGEGWTIAVSCDLASLQTAWVESLVQRCDDEHAAVAFRSEFWEPFPAAYHTSLLPVVVELLESGRGSFQWLLSDARARAIGLPRPSDWPAVPQINTREDLERFTSDR